MLMLITLLLLLVQVYGQPCVAPAKLVEVSTVGACDTSPSAPLTFPQTTITSATSFTIGGWFSLDVKGTQSYSLFRVTTNTGDTSGTSTGGIRATLIIHDEIVDFKYTSATLQTVSKPFLYTIKKWFYAAVSISYSTGGVNHYVWQPQSDIRIINAITLSANFNTALDALTEINVLYWGPYGSYCGSVDKVYFYTGYFENGILHNWMNLAYLGNTIDLSYKFRLEDQVGQKVYSGVKYGYLGQNKGIDQYDPVLTYYAQFSSTQYITLPYIQLASSQYTISFWLWSNIAIVADADTADAVFDTILYRRIYQGSQDQLVVMLIQSGGNYQLKLKILTQMYTIVPVITASAWTHVSIALAYPGSNPGVTKIIYDVSIMGTLDSHQVTTLSNSYVEDVDDQIYLGDSRNQFTGNFRMSNLQFHTSYVNYYGVSVSCITSCVHSTNSFTQKHCLRCTNFQQDGGCVGTCAAGQTGVVSLILPQCSQCAYQCYQCNAAICTSCNAGYYLQGTSCVLATACTVGYLADPVARKCTQCGNGVINAPEVCDDGNLVDLDGCTNCVVDTNYSCSGATSVCINKCGNGVIDAPEQCDNGGKLINGCINCVIENNYICSGAPSVCTLKCGNGKRTAEEFCDDGNLIINDGCSYCMVDAGYKCTGGTPTTVDSCTKLCPNGVLDQSEECDDNNNTAGDGCYKCRVEMGWSCTPTCIKLCGNGVMDQFEQCDDGNAILNDGCSNCKIDANYNCSGGTSCTAIVPKCGDGYKNTVEVCEDGNTVDGDGCSGICVVESGYNCVVGLYAWSLTTCTPICGDGIIILPEQCDDNNTINNDGCSSVCTIEYKCGDGNRQGTEQCDDGNTVNYDGCTNCIIDVGYNCQLIIGSKTDNCVKCVDNCAECGDVCIRCVSSYYLYNDIQCVSACPQGYYDNDKHICVSCPKGCIDCKNGSCTQCGLSSYLKGDQCVVECGDGYFEEPNAVMGNSCQPCFVPCLKCTSATDCSECEELYYITDGQCISCNMGSQCIHCEDEQCTECIVGYQPNDKVCDSIAADCGDGLHALAEQCDDSGYSGGCNDCKVQSGWHCILEQNEGPDVCFELIPLNITTYIDDVHFDKLYIQFSRPLSQSYNFTELLFIDIPQVKEYSYQYRLLDMSTLQVTFQFNETVQNQYCLLNFSTPNMVIDKFGWSLVGMANESASDIAPYGLLKSKLNYYIYYSTDELQFSYTLSYIAIAFTVMACLTSFIYMYKIGAGQVWQILFSLQFIALLRFVNMRYSTHVDEVLHVLSYTSLTFIPSLFIIDTPVQQSQPKFQLSDYPSEFLLSTGGIFLSLIFYLIVLLGIVKLLIKLIAWEPLLNRLEDVNEYLQFQGFIRVLEVMFLELMVSFIQSMQVYTEPIQIASMVIAIFCILSFIGLAVLFYKFVVRIDDAYKLEWLHIYCNCVYDGFDLRSKLGRHFIFVPYCQKFIFALAFISNTAIIQVAIIVAIRIMIYPPLFKYNPYTTKLLLIRQFAQAFLDIATVLCFLVFLNQDDNKDTKVSNGWLVFMAIIINILHFTIWNTVMLFLKLQAPDYLLEEAEAEQENNKGAVLQRKKSRLREARMFMDDEKVRLEEAENEPKRNSKIGQGQIAPADYVQPPDVKQAQIAPVGFEEQPRVGPAQVAPYKDPLSDPQSNISAPAQPKKPKYDFENKVLSQEAEAEKAKNIEEANLVDDFFS